MLRRKERRCIFTNRLFLLQYVAPSISSDFQVYALLQLISFQLSSSSLHLAQYWAWHLNQAIKKVGFVGKLCLVGISLFQAEPTLGNLTPPKNPI